MTDPRKIARKLAGGIVRNAQGELLLIHRCTPGRTQWELPGGEVEPGEDPKAAVCRELKEELDVQVKVLDEVGGDSFDEDGQRMDYTWFNAQIVSGTPRPVEPKHDRAEYFAWDRLSARRDELSANTRNLLDAHKSQKIKLP